MYSVFKIKLDELRTDDMWLMTDDGYIYHIQEGTGDNLTEEDIDDGYKDYIYIDIYANMTDIIGEETYDGGMILLKKLYKDMTIKEIIKEVEDFYDIKFIVEQ